MSRVGAYVRRVAFADLRACGYDIGRKEASRSVGAFRSCVYLERHPWLAEPGEECFDLVYEGAVGAAWHRLYLGEMVSPRGAWEFARALHDDDAFERDREQLHGYAACSPEARGEVEFLLSVLPDVPDDFWSPR